jgi:DNA-binding transcriptional ArsR family regulator
MKSTYVLRNLKQVRVLASPTRLRILEAFGQSVMTTKQMALHLGEKPTRLYHHVDALEEAGLVRLVRTKKNRGTTEKYYAAVAKEFMVDRGYLELTHGSKKVTSKYEVLFLNALRTTLQESKESITAGLIRPAKNGLNAVVYRCRGSLSEREVKTIIKRIQKLIRSFPKKGHGERQYGFTIALYPVSSNKKNPKQK